MLFFGQACGIWKLPGQGFDPNRRIDTAGVSIHCATKNSKDLLVLGNLPLTLVHPAPPTMPSRQEVLSKH